jgi:hypothetical protein
MTAPSLTAYRTRHTIVVDDSGPLPVCAVDSIRIHPTRVGGWVHDQGTTDRLHREDVRAMVNAVYPTHWTADPDPCYTCGRSVADGLYVRIDFGNTGIRNICHNCEAKADDGAYVVVPA